MRDMNWNDLKYLLAVARAGGIAGAARALAVDDTTVSRRLDALSRALGEDLLLRPARGRPRLTPAGREIAEQAEEMERAADAAVQLAGRAADQARGVVRLTATPILINHLLAPALGRLHAAHPDLTVELIPASQNLDLVMREADLALRLARPVLGGGAVLARKVGALPYRVWRAKKGAEAWIGYEDGAARLPQARWIAGRIEAGEAAAPIRVSDAETARAAAIAGLGRTLLPAFAAADEVGLVAEESFGAPVSRDVWLLSHARHKNRPAPHAVALWIEDAIRN